MQYYHRNTATEILGLVKGDYGGRSDDFQPGGLSFETGFCPHGVAVDVFDDASTTDLRPAKIQEGCISEFTPMVVDVSMCFDVEW